MLHDPQVPIPEGIRYSKVGEKQDAFASFLNLQSPVSEHVA